MEWVKSRRGIWKRELLDALDSHEDGTRAGRERIRKKDSRSRNQTASPIKQVYNVKVVRCRKGNKRRVSLGECGSGYYRSKRLLVGGSSWERFPLLSTATGSFRLVSLLAIGWVCACAVLLPEEWVDALVRMDQIDQT